MAKIYLQTKLSGTQGQVVGFNSSGNAEAQTFSGGFSPKILYTAASGLTVTATKGSTIVNATYASGVYTMSIPEFGTWVVSNGSSTTDVEVSEVKNYEAVFVSSTLQDNSWATISSISNKGTATNYWNVGDCKSVVINGTLSDGLTLSNTTLWVFIIGFDHDLSTEYSGGHTITFNGFKASNNGSDTYALCDSGYNSSKISGTWFNMNNSNDNTGSWTSSRMRSTIMSNIYNALESSLQSVIKTVKKDSIAVYNQITKQNPLPEDKLFLLSESEIFGSSGTVGTNKFAKTTEGSQYAWFSNKGITPTAYSNNVRKQYTTSAQSSTCYWWERSPCYDYSDSFCDVLTDGSAGNGGASYSIGVAPAFCV